MKPTLHVWAMMVAKAVSTRAECPKRQVGCVLLNKLGHIVSTGYNGPPSGVSDCSVYCKNQCKAVHAEINAIKQIRFDDIVVTAVCTCLPCENCFMNLLNLTRMTTLVYSEVSKNSIDIKLIPETIKLEKI